MSECVCFLSILLYFGWIFAHSLNGFDAFSLVERFDDENCAQCAQNNSVGSLDGMHIAYYCDPGWSMSGKLVS